MLEVINELALWHQYHVCVASMSCLCCINIMFVLSCSTGNSFASLIQAKCFDATPEFILAYGLCAKNVYAELTLQR